MVQSGPDAAGWRWNLAAMVVVRVAGVAGVLLAVAATRTRANGGSFWAAGAVSGVLDTAGNLFFLVASRAGRLDSAAVVCSLYPAGTILLAAVVLHERPTGRQMAGMGLALVAVALLSL